MKKTLFTLSLLLSLTIGAQTIAPGNIYQFKKTITSGQMSTIGAVPVTILSAPGSGKRIAVIQGTVNISRSGGTTSGYTFATSDSSPVLLINTIAVGIWSLSGGTTFLNSNTSEPSDYPAGGLFNIDFTNQALTFTTEDSANPTAGDNSITISFLYTITQ